MNINDLNIKENLETITADISDLKQHFPLTYKAAGQSSTVLKLDEFANYIIVAGDDHNGDVYYSNMWLVMTPRNDTKKGLVLEICGNGSSSTCTLNGLTLTVTHYAYAAISITKL